MQALRFSWKKPLLCRSEPSGVHNPQARADSEGPAVVEASKYHRLGYSRSFESPRKAINVGRSVLEKPIRCSSQFVESSGLFQNASHETICQYRDSDTKVHDMEPFNSIFRPGALGSNVVSQSSINETPVKRFSGCYDYTSAQYMLCCKSHSVAGSSPPSLQPVCQICGEPFTKYRTLEDHHLIKHAVTELTIGDSPRNIVEIIFRTSWLNSKMPDIKVERILKVNNMKRTLVKFEEYRDAVKTKASKVSKKHPRCLADGNELLRFHGTTFLCSLGMNGSSSLCSLASCNACNIIRRGFLPKRGWNKGIYTSATSGRAHESISASTEELPRTKRAMVVCRVIAGRVQKVGYDSKEAVCVQSTGVESSVGGEEEAGGGRCSDIEELYVFNPNAILPCFVVIYEC